MVPQYNDDYWKDLYFDIRNHEENNLLTDFKMNHEKRYIKKVKKHLDNFDDIGYINGMFSKEIYKQPFGITDILRRDRKSKELKEDPMKGKSILGGSSGGY